MRYALLVNHGEPAPGEIPDDAIAATQVAFGKYADDLITAGVLVGADILVPSEATTTVTLREGSLKIQDGPFVESKEMLAGVFVIDVPDLDAALAWAQRCPAAQYGVIEVRPAATSIIDGNWSDGCRLDGAGA
ncbi:YciI family protein [Aldersonia sp. NBC_00410]|uniref:YciI family protein n=1 Tax=Aldersonia sp. NBC_00410 TaxID=2975954 RepID=UPI00224D12AD|nr:YciI family protein [Aldersonia sp. NBC_00410]MCX5044425.1 YciI family protein [Aldersonia sp. NBC_00410]